MKKLEMLNVSSNVQTALQNSCRLCSSQLRQIVLLSNVQLLYPDGIPLQLVKVLIVPLKLFKEINSDVVVRGGRCCRFAGSYSKYQQSGLSGMNSACFILADSSWQKSLLSLHLSTEAFHSSFIHFFSLCCRAYQDLLGRPELQVTLAGRCSEKHKTNSSPSDVFDSLFLC